MASANPNESFLKLYQTYINAAIDLTAGSAGGAASVIVGQPLDTLKVKMQAFPNLYKNTFVCLKQTVAKEKFRGLYAGSVPALVATVSENAVLFVSFGLCQNFVKSIVQKETTIALNPFENASAGFLAGFFPSVVICPTELIKCRLQTMREKQNSSKNKKQDKIGPWIITKKIVKEEGILGLFRGFKATLVRGMPGFFCYFGAYDLSRNALTPTGKTKDNIGLLRTGLAGGIGGLAFWITVFPADVLKSRIQASNINTSMIKLLKEILKTEGFKGLYKGFGPTLLRTFPATGSLFIVYEYSKKYLKGYISS